MAETLQKEKKMYYDQTRAWSRTHSNTGKTFQRWSDVRDREGLKTDADVALVLFDR